MKINNFLFILLTSFALPGFSFDEIIKIQPIPPIIEEKTIPISIAPITPNQPKNEPKELTYFTSSLENKDNAVYLYCECERWGTCRKTYADKIFIKLYKDDQPKFEIAVTPGNLNYSYDLPLEKLSKKGTYEGRLSPLLVDILLLKNEYQISYLDPIRNDTINVSLNRQDLRLLWGNRNYHQCSIVNEQDFKSKTTKVVNSGLKGFIKQTNRKIDQMIKAQGVKNAQEALKNRPNKI
tara:strand:+ start:609 stop:1319 length:711 start_codon:yes stop_codon:yes gene_type:complete